MCNIQTSSFRISEYEEQEYVKGRLTLPTSALPSYEQADVGELCYQYFKLTNLFV